MTATGVKIPPAPVSRNATTSIFDWRSGDEPLRAHTEGNIGAVKESSASRANYVVVPQGEGRTTVSEWRDGGGGPGARGLVQDVTNVAARTESGSEKRAEDATAVKSSASEAAAPIGEMNDLRTSVGNGTKNDAAVAAMVGAEVAARMAPAGNFGRVLARAVGTPTVDAISGDVHLVAVVGGKRSLTRLLHFVDLVSDHGFFGSTSFESRMCLYSLVLLWLSCLEQIPHVPALHRKPEQVLCRGGWRLGDSLWLCCRCLL